MESIDVRIPTIAMIPNAIISMVSEVRNFRLRIETSEIFIISVKTAFFIIQKFPNG